MALGWDIFDAELGYHADGSTECTKNATLMILYTATLP